MRSVSQKPFAQALVFLGQNGKVTKETPQGTDGSLPSLHGLLPANGLVPAARFVRKAFWCKYGIAPASLFAAAPLKNVEADSPTFCKDKRTNEGGAEGHATFKEVTSFQLRAVTESKN